MSFLSWQPSWPASAATICNFAHVKIEHLSHACIRSQTHWKQCKAKPKVNGIKPCLDRAKQTHSNYDAILQFGFKFYQNFIVNMYAHHWANEIQSLLPDMFLGHSIWKPCKRTRVKVCYIRWRFCTAQV